MGALDVDGQIISFNPIDIINNYHCQLPLEMANNVWQSEVWDLRLRADKTTPHTSYNPAVERVVARRPQAETKK